VQFGSFDIDVSEEPVAFILTVGEQAARGETRCTNERKRDETEVEVILRPTVSRPDRLGVRHPSGTRDQFFFLPEIFLRQLRVCYF
jgi:hypothetical protein